MRTLILMLCRNDRDRVADVLAHLSETTRNKPDVEILVVDDGSTDDTFEIVETFLRNKKNTRLHIAKRTRPQGYGGNLKRGFRYALENRFDVVIPMKIGERNPELFVDGLIRPFEDENIDCVLGIPRLTIMNPLHILVRGLTVIQSVLAGVPLQGWNTPCKAYRTRALALIAFELNTHQRHFDTEVLLQLIDQRKHIKEIPVSGSPETLGHEAEVLWHSIGFLKATLKYRLQRYNLFYDARFHPELLLKTRGRSRSESLYEGKPNVDSPHSFVYRRSELIPHGAKVLDIGCAGGYVAESLIQSKSCTVVGVDLLPEPETKGQFEYHQIDIEREFDRLAALIEKGNFDVILALDVLEHLSTPELFMLNLYKIRYKKMPTFMFSTGNVAFIVIRLSLMFGYFNYGKKGILDITHKRLFSTRTFKNLLDQTGFIITGKKCFPVPFLFLGFPPRLCRWLETINNLLIAFNSSLFSYQIMFTAIPLEQDEARASTRPGHSK